MPPISLELTDYDGNRFTWDQGLGLWFPVVYPKARDEELGRVVSNDEDGQRIVHLHPVVEG